jgi:hypothetical protein
LGLIEDALAGVGNISVERPAYREALWQAYLSRGDCTTFEAIETAASGCSLGEIIASYREDIERSALNRVEGTPVWQFITSAPVKPRKSEHSSSATSEEVKG